MKLALSRAPVVVVVVVLGVIATALAAGCVKKDVAVESSPLTDNLSKYWTCAVAYASDGHGEDANEAFTFVPWFEGRVRERGVFDPLARDEGAEAEVTLRLEASQGTDRVSLHLTVIDTRTKESLGELDAAGTVDPNVATAADAGSDTSEPPRIVALRAAADHILDLLQEKRRASIARAKLAPAVAARPPLPDGPPVAGSAVCTTECQAPASTSSSHAEQYQVAAGINPTMKELRACLDRVNAQLVVPAVLLRFAPDGELRHMRVDVGGYEQLECIQQVRARPPRRVTTSRASLLRCEYRCTVS